MTGIEHITDRQRTPRQAPADRDPHGEVHLALQTYQRLRATCYASQPERGRRLAEQVTDTFHTCPIPEIARLGRTLRRWRDPILAHFATGGVNNGGTEAINLIIEKTRRHAHGFRSFNNYRLRILLAADGTRPSRKRPAR